MPTLGLKSPPPGLMPEEYRDYIKSGIEAEIARVGAENVLWHKEFVIFYSGPSKTVIYILKYDPLNNDGRSLRMAGEMDASRINDAQAFVFLDRQDLDAYFTPVLAPSNPNPRKLEAALDSAYAEVWGGISELFAKMDFRRVATAVCGADQKRVFIKDEFPALIENNHVETINNIDMEAVRKVFREVSAGEAFKLVCLSELKMMFGWAGTGSKFPVTTWNDYFERIKFYEKEREDTESIIGPLTPAQECRKQEIIAEFGLASLYATATETWGGPAVPVSKSLPEKATLALK